MKIVKHLRINDGKNETIMNGSFLLIEDFPRESRIVGSFLSKGWDLLSVNPVYTPALQKPGSFSFYRGGHDYIFAKECESVSDDDSDSILREVLKEIESEESDNKGSISFDDYEEDYDYDFRIDEEDFDEGDYDEDDYDEDDSDEEDSDEDDSGDEYIY